MNTILIACVGILLLALILQVLYAGYFLVKGSQLPAVASPKKLTLGDQKNPQFKLFISGDSVGAGLGADSFEKSVAGRIAYYIAQDKYVHYQNESISGARMEKLLSMQMPDEKQDIIVLIVSSNDLFKFTSIDEFKKDTEAVVSKYGQFTDKLIIVGPGRVFDGESVPLPLRSFYKHRSPEYVKVLDAIAKTNSKVVHVDPTAPDFYNDSHGPTTASDKFHPNDEGHRLWFELIKPALINNSMLQ